MTVMSQVLVADSCPVHAACSHAHIYVGLSQGWIFQAHLDRSCAPSMLVGHLYMHMLRGCARCLGHMRSLAVVSPPELRCLLQGWHFLQQRT